LHRDRQTGSVQVSRRNLRPGDVAEFANLAHLIDVDAEVRAGANKTIGINGLEAVVVLKSQLNSPDEKLRIEAANLLAEHRESKTQPEPIDNDEYRGGIPQRIVCPKMGSSWD